VGSGVNVGTGVGVEEGIGDAEGAEDGEAKGGVTVSTTGDDGGAGAKMRHARPTNTNRTNSKRFILRKSSPARMQTFAMSRYLHVSTSATSASAL
jgi:hypothetical protein